MLTVAQLLAKVLWIKPSLYGWSIVLHPGHVVIFRCSVAPSNSTIMLVSHSLTRGSATGLCRAECHKFDPRNTQNFLSETFSLNRKSLLSYSVYRFSGQAVGRSAHGKGRTKLLHRGTVSLNIYLKWIVIHCLASLHDLIITYRLYFGS